MAKDLQTKGIKLPRALWGFLEDLAGECGYHDKRGDHSKLVREMVSSSATKWRQSPYVCRAAEYTVLVTGNGDVFTRQVQDLQLNTKRDKLPCILEMKPEKQQDFLASLPRGVEEAAWFRSQWLLNYFAAWHGHKPQGELLAAWVDRKGTDVKLADLPVGLGPGAVLTREVVVGIHKYVQWRGPKHGDDRADFPIDIPTRNLEIVVVVDLDLYRKTPLAEEEIHLLQLEFRNREAALFVDDTIAHDPSNPMDDLLVGRYTEERPNPKAEQILKHLAEFKQRIEFVAQAKVGGKPVVSASQKDELARALQIPKRFLFYKLRWPSPYFGLVVCVRWEKPTPPE